MRLRRNEQGLASIIIVGVMVILLALITLGFAKIMNRAVNNSLNNQLSAAANYAAQSAVNDAMAYIKGQPSPSDVSATDCTSLLKEPGMSNLVDLSGDGNTKITCLLVNPTPKDLMYQQLAPNDSQVIKATTSDAIDRVMFSWQASNGINNSLPSSTTFSDVPTWNTAGNVPVLRVGLYPVPPDGKIANIEANSRTFFLVPGTGGATVTTIPYSTADGSVIQVACNAKNTGINGFTADYTCNTMVNGLYTNIEPDSYYYLTVTPIYNQADVKIKATNVQSQQVQFENVQTVIDATAKANDAAKRLQERVDSNTDGDNLMAGGSGSDSAAPAYAIRSAKALCKQIEFHKSWYNYILNDAPANCNSGASGTPTVPPTLTLSITGNNGNDSGVTRDSGDATPSGSGYNGAVYINNLATINWKSTDAAISCNASGGWSGDKNPASSWSGVTGTGSQSTGTVNRYTQYSMQCKGPGGTTSTKTVTAWPPPHVSISGSGSYNAGGSYSVSWSAYNVTKCTMYSTGNNYWNEVSAYTYNNLDPSITNGDSKSFGTSWDDHSTKTYQIRCWDASGRSDISSTWTVAISPTFGGPGGNSNGYAPPCSANASFSGHSTSNATISWSVSCSGVPTNLSDVYISTNVDNIGNGINTVAGGGAGNVRITRADTYYFQIYIWAPGWRTQAEASAYGSTSGDGEANSGQKGPWVVYPPLNISNVTDTVAWDQGPNECSYVVANTPPYTPSNPQYGYHSEWPDGTWWCRNGRFPDPNGSHHPYYTPGCPDGSHKWTMCYHDFHFDVSGGAPGISCTAGVYGYGSFRVSGPGDGTWYNSTDDGWVGGGLVNGYFWVRCSDSAGQQASYN